MQWGIKKAAPGFLWGAALLEIDMLFIETFGIIHCAINKTVPCGTWASVLCHKAPNDIMSVTLYAPRGIALRGR